MKLWDHLKFVQKQINNHETSTIKLSVPNKLAMLLYWSIPWKWQPALEGLLYGGIMSQSPFLPNQKLSGWASSGGGILHQPCSRVTINRYWRSLAKGMVLIVLCRFLSPRDYLQNSIRK